MSEEVKPWTAMGQVIDRSVRAHHTLAFLVNTPLSNVPQEKIREVIHDAYVQLHAALETFDQHFGKKETKS